MLVNYGRHCLHPKQIFQAIVAHFKIADGYVVNCTQDWGKEIIPDMLLDNVNFEKNSFSYLHSRPAHPC